MPVKNPKSPQVRAYPRDLEYLESLRRGKEYQADVVKRVLDHYRACSHTVIDPYMKLKEVKP